MKKVNKNSLVSISIKTTDEGGNLLDENEELIYLHGGYGQIFPKLEEELEGKKIGDSFSLSLTPSQAFGEYDESLVQRESIEELPQDLTLGMELEVEDEDHIWMVESIEDGYALLNANHP
ncbi:MAG: FKBP-type peptidyl-prolyl cis-trans isomerase, partial [Campylobacterota bacterium]|nr:FKBP-type peptidyl-prolyl cis-trans isomerase [Campylobacterota bacterium]